MEPHGRDQPQEEIMEDMIRGETDDITKLFLMESGEGDESLGGRDRSAEEEVKREDCTPPMMEKPPTALVTTTEKPTAPVTKKPRYGPCICILINSASAIYIHMLTLCLLSALRIDEIFQKETARPD